MAQYLLGIDNGGTMTKAALFDLGGREAAVASRPTPVIHPAEGRAERDMNLLWEITASVIREAIEKAGIDSGDIAGIGCTGHGKGLYLWSRENRPASHAIASTDSRAADYVKRWNSDGTARKAAEKTCQPVLACQPVSLLAWLRDHDRAVYDNILWVFEAKDYIRFMLTGEAFAEMTDYSGTGMMDLHRAVFDRELLSLFGIPEVYEKLPPLRHSYEQCGAVSEPAALMTGLRPGTPVCGGMFDIDACAVAMDVTDEDTLCVITGTWSINEYISKTLVTGCPSTLNSFFCVPGYYLIEESSPTSAGNLEWAIDRLMGREKDEAKRRGLSVYRQIDEMVDRIPPEENGILFFPFLYGSNTAGMESAAFLGINSSHEAAQLLRAVFEGVVFSHATHIDRLIGENAALRSVRLAGGAANSRVWVQMFADILQRPVEVVGVKELGTLGCAVAAAVAAGCYSDYKAAAMNMLRPPEIVSPDPGRAEIYQKKYRRYRKAMELLSQIG